MRKQFSTTILAASFALALAFTFGCSDGGDDDGGSGGSNGGSNLSNLPKQVYLNDGSEYKGNSDLTIHIYPDDYYLGYDYILVGKIQNGQVLLDLPKKIDEKYLKVFDAFCSDEYVKECNVSFPKNTDYIWAEVLPLLDDERHITLDLYSVKENSGLGRAFFLYLSKPGKITGKLCYEYDGRKECENFDLNCSEGWNIIYGYFNNNNEIVYTSNFSTNWKLKWILND